MVKKQACSIFMIVLLSLILLSCAGGGVSPAHVASNAVSEISWVPLNGNDTNYTDRASKVTGLIVSGNELYFSNTLGNLWKSSVGDVLSINVSLSSVPPKGVPPKGVPTLVKVGSFFSPVNVLMQNLTDNFYVALANGDIEYLRAGVWEVLHKSNKLANSQITSMVVTNGNSFYMGNQASQVWYYSANDDSWQNIALGSDITSAGGIIYLMVDNQLVPAYLVTLGRQGGVWMYSIEHKIWLDLIKYASSHGFDMDHSSKINAIGLYVAPNQNYYGYFANEKGHVWRMVFQGATMQLISCDNLSDNPNFIGYEDHSAITYLKVDNNNLWVATKNGNLWYLQSGVHNWIKLNTKKQGVILNGIINFIALPMSSLAPPNKIFAGDDSGNIWQITWK